MKQFVRAVVLSVGGLALLSSTAMANTITPTPTPIITGTGPYTWTYEVNLEGNSQVNTGDFFTIFDFAGFTGVATAPNANWTFSSNLTGTCNPQVVAVCTAFDSATIANLTWTYNGPAFNNTAGGTATPPTQLLIGNFSAQSIFNLPTNDWWVSQDDDLQTNTMNEGAAGNTNVPMAQTVPDGGSTAALLGSVLVGFGILRRKISNI